MKNTDNKQNNKQILTEEAELSDILTDEECEGWEDITPAVGKSIGEIITNPDGTHLLKHWGK